MDKIDKYLNERNIMTTEKEVLSQMGTIEANTLKTAYYGVGDHIEKLAIMLNGLTGDSGLFGKDLKNAVKARDAFRKITLGKYI